MRITVDTNVLVSSSFWKGSSDKVLEKVEKREIKLIISEEIIKEFLEVLDYKEIQDKVKEKNLEMKRTVEKIISISELVSPKNRIDVIKEDEDDNRILECAFEGKVEFIVSYDKCLLKLGEFGGIRIVTPEEFLKIIEKRYTNKD